MQIAESSPYQNFLYALKSNDVKRQYPVMLTKFLDFANIEGNNSIEERCLNLYEFASKSENHKAIESELMRYINFHENRVLKKEIASGTLRNYVKAVKLFFTMNDILVNWDKIKMGMPTAVQTSNDRIPEISEINKLLEYPDIRIKPIVLIMLSSGIRVGAWNWLKWKHIIPQKREDGQIIAAKIIVYAGEPEQYFSFITPEAYHAIKEYMDFRQMHGEIITGDSWLVRNQWQKIDKRHGHRIGSAGNPQKLDGEGIRRLIYDSWKVQGVLSVHHRKNNNNNSNNNNNLTSEEKHHPFKASHGFRKFFQTKCEQVMKSEDVEILMGHGSSKRGLKANYYRPKEEYLLEQYLKAVDLLTINEEYKLRIENDVLKQEQKKHEHDIKILREDMNEQIKLLLRMIQENQDLSKVKPEVLLSTKDKVK